MKRSPVEMLADLREIADTIDECAKNPVMDPQVVFDAIKSGWPLMNHVITSADDAESIRWACDIVEKVRAMDLCGGRIDAKETAVREDDKAVTYLDGALPAPLDEVLDEVEKRSTNPELNEGPDEQLLFAEIFVWMRLMKRRLEEANLQIVIAPMVPGTARPVVAHERRRQYGDTDDV